MASMRVYDLLRCLEVVRGLPGVDRRRVAVAARGEMAVVALYAALMDGAVHAVLVEDPPATQNAPSRDDGRGAAIEMLHCLRVTDLAQVAVALWPTKLWFIGETHDAYQWARQTYETIGHGEACRSIGSVAAWSP